MQRPLRKLTIRKDTVRNLSQEELARAVGGNLTTTAGRSIAINLPSASTRCNATTTN